MSMSVIRPMDAACGLRPWCRRRGGTGPGGVMLLGCAMDDAHQPQHLALVTRLSPADSIVRTISPLAIGRFTEGRIFCDKSLELTVASGSPSLVDAQTYANTLWRCSAVCSAQPGLPSRANPSRARDILPASRTAPSSPCASGMRSSWPNAKGSSKPCAAPRRPFSKPGAQATSSQTRFPHWRDARQAS